MLKGTNLCKTFNDQLVINDVSLEVEPGQICVIIGPSGSGKTTLLRVLSLLEDADSGTVEVDEWKCEYPVVRGRRPAPPWPLLTVVFQQLFLWPHLTLYQNITLPLMIQNKDTDNYKLNEFVRLFEMEKFISRYPNQASLGQRQRAAIVRALLLEPKYLLLDEITSSLDVEQVAIILQHLKELAERGIAILTVTHLLHFAQTAADRIIFMDSGKVIESGGREVLQSPSQERVKKFLSVIESAT